MIINYFDLGLYKDGLELEEVYKNILPKFNLPFRCYGIEANPYYMKELKAKFKDKIWLDIFNLAICDKNEQITLYLSKNQIGDSIYDTKKGLRKRSVNVRGSTFSNFLEDNNIQLEGNINICKINIEGAEWVFFKELVDKDLLKHFNLFCGSGDDVNKIGEFVENGIDKDYEKLLQDNNITIYPFCMTNNKDKNIDFSTTLDTITKEHRKEFVRDMIYNLKI
jgi:FkbM family methyltransferase